VAADSRIETVRALLDTVGRNDVEAALSLVTPDVSFVDVLAPLESTVRDVRGQSGLRAWFAGLHEPGVKEVTAEPFDLQDLGDGRVVGAVRVRQRHSVSSFAMVVYGIWGFANGRICRIHSYFDRELALRDAGLGADSGLMRRWVEGLIREKHEDRRAVLIDAPEFDGNEFSVAGGLWDELAVGAQGFAEVEHGQLLSWQPFDASLNPR
jgi:ketosteroid isomerase-like protein